MGHFQFRLVAEQRLLPAETGQQQALVGSLGDQRRLVFIDLHGQMPQCAAGLIDAQRRLAQGIFQIGGDQPDITGIGDPIAVSDDQGATIGQSVATTPFAGWPLAKLVMATPSGILTGSALSVSPFFTRKNIARP